MRNDGSDAAAPHMIAQVFFLGFFVEDVVTLESITSWAVFKNSSSTFLFSFAELSKKGHPHSAAFRSPMDFFTVCWLLGRSTLFATRTM